MPLIITRPKPRPNGSNVAASLDWLMDLAQQAIDYLKGLVMLGADVREERSLGAERAVLTPSQIVTNAAVFAMQTIEPRTVAETFTTAAIAFDTASGAGRYRIDGVPPIPNSATAAAGMPIPAGGFLLVVTGALNIRSFQVTAQAAAALNMTVTLFK